MTFEPVKKGKLSTRLAISDSLTSNDFWITINIRQTGEITFSHRITKSCAAATKSCAAALKPSTSCDFIASALLCT